MKWHKQQEDILKKWGESCSCLRYLHYRTYQKFKKYSFRFTLPIIVISTITGTANFAHETFPESWASYYPLVIGGFNIFAGILTTILQFLKINELMEAHRVSSIHYGKLYRNIYLELSLPQSERTHEGIQMLDICKTEYDRLIEQSPPIPSDILERFEFEFPYPDFQKPEISTISKIDPFRIEIVDAAATPVSFRDDMTMWGPPTGKHITTQWEPPPPDAIEVESSVETHEQQCTEEDTE